MDVTLRADRRDETGSAPARRLRARGLVPGVLYGAGVDTATPVAVDRRDLVAALSGAAGTNALITLDIDGASHLTLARELQRDPVRRELLHVDFVAVRRDQAVTADIPVDIVGEAGRGGGDVVVSLVLPTLTVSCVPGDLPDRIEVDVSGLESAGDSIRAGQVALPRGVTLVTDPDEPIVSVSVTSVVEEEIAAEVTPEEAPEGGPLADEGGREPLSTPE